MTASAGVSVWPYENDAVIRAATIRASRRAWSVRASGHDTSRTSQRPTREGAAFGTMPQVSAGSTANRVSRRAALGALGAGALAWAAWPRPSRDRARAPRGRKVLYYWEKWTGIEGVALQA